MSENRDIAYPINGITFAETATHSLTQATLKRRCGEEIIYGT